MSTTASASEYSVREAPVRRLTGRELQRILVATAGASSSRGALVAASALAARHGAQIEVVSIFQPRIPYPAPRDGGFPAIPYSDRDPARRQVTLVRQQLAALGMNADDPPFALVAGQPAHIINKLARAGRADLIVIGLGRENAAERGLGDRGSMAIAGAVDRPLLAVERNFDGNVDDVMIAVGVDETAVAAFEVAQELFPAPRRLHLVHVTEMVPNADRSIQRQIAAIRNSLTKWRPARVETWLLNGDPIDQLLTFSREHLVDLVVGGMHGHSFAERAIMRNAALWLMALGDRSVLLVPMPP